MGGRSVHKNGCALPRNTSRLLAECRILKALLAKHVGRNKFLNDSIGNTRSLSRAYHDFESMKLHGCLGMKKKSPSGNSHAGNEAIEICVNVIMSNFSANAWFVCCHFNLPLSVLLESTDIQEKKMTSWCISLTRIVKLARLKCFMITRCLLEKMC